MGKWKYSVSSSDIPTKRSPFLLCGSIAENLQKASEIGYDAIEVHTREDALIDFDAVARAFGEYNVGISAVMTGKLSGQGGVCLSDDRPYAESAAVQAFYSYIDIAAAWKADLVIGKARGSIVDHGDPKRYLDRLARNLRLVCGRAADKGVKVNLEVICRYETNIFNTARETCDFIADYDIGNCYVHLDAFHMGIEETDSYEAIRRCRGKLGYFHAADNTRLYPGTGTFDFAVILRTLSDSGYDGFISVECMPFPDGETAARKALEYLKKIETKTF